MNIIDLRRSIISSVVALILTVILFLISSLLTLIGVVPDGNIRTTTVIITILAAFISGFLTSRNVYDYGLINGLATGFIYFLILVVLSAIITFSFAFSANFFLSLLFILLSSGIGGIVGINSRSRRQRKRRGYTSSYKRMRR